MAASIRNREFNIRVFFDQNGDPVIGMVQGFYVVNSNITDIKPIPDSTVLQIAKKLGIERSSRSISINRQAAKAKKAEEKQQNLFQGNQQLA